MKAPLWWWVVDNGEVVHVSAKTYGKSLYYSRLNFAANLLL